MRKNFLKTKCLVSNFAKCITKLHLHCLQLVYLKLVSLKLCHLKLAHLKFVYLKFVSKIKMTKEENNENQFMIMLLW